jgi:predicted transcriptional regulator of viral defense system
MGDALAVTEDAPTGATPNRERLFEMASEQGGYFTTGQARECGYSGPLMTHHVRGGRFVRVRRGLYRLREYPSSPREDVLAAWLAVGKGSAVVSHESALDLLDLSDVIPDAAHVTVPRSRRNLPKLPGVKIHTTTRELGPDDLTFRDGMVVTSAARTILDAAQAGTAPDQIERAVRQAVGRGLARPETLRLRAAERGRRVATLIEGALGGLAA